MNNGVFWQVIHPVTLLLFIVCLVVNGQTERKRYVLIPMIIYIIVLVITFAFFVPELLSLIGTPYANTVDDSLTARGTRWQVLSMIRGTILLLTAIFLLSGLTKADKRPDAAL